MPENLRAQPKATRREWIGLAVIALPCVLYAIDGTVLYLAVPHISEALKPTSAQLLWILDIYGFVVAGSLITMGNLGDRIGRRRLLMIGAAAFGVTSVIAAFSTSAAMLIAARALLGVAGATLAPSTLSLIRTMFRDPQQRTFAISIWVTSFSIGGAIGPILGGIVLDHFWWGAVFLLGVPVMALLLIVGPRLLPEFRDPKAEPVDIISAVLSLAAVLLVIFGLKRIAEQGHDVLAAISVAAGVLAGVVFVRRQPKLAHPLIDLQLFRSGAFSTALATYMLASFATFGAYIFIAQHLQLVLGLSPLEAGLWSLPSFGAFVLGSMIVPAMARKIASAKLIAAGLVIAAIGFGVLTQIDHASPLAVIVIGSVICWFGVSPVFVLATDIIVGSAPIERAGAAAAISETSSELGAALGIAILGSIGMAVYRMRMAATMPYGVPSDAKEIARGTLGGATAIAERLPGQLGAALLGTARDAFVQAFVATAAITAAIALAAAIATTLMLRQGIAPTRARILPRSVHSPSPAVTADSTRPRT
jgi:MFS transporter, DHA2 family, multidrug resistance protein